MSVAQLTPQICTDQMEFLVEPKNVMKKKSVAPGFQWETKKCYGFRLSCHQVQYEMHDRT